MTKNILTIDLSSYGIRVNVSKGGFVVQEFQKSFNSALEFKVKDQLKEMVSENGWKQLEVDDVALSWSSKMSTLLPMNVFNDSSKEDIHNLCFGSLVSGYDIDYNRLSQFSIVNVYAINEWVKSFFVLNFPRVVIQHEGTLIVRQLLANSSLKPKAIASFHKEHFLFAMVLNNDVKYYNYFDYTNAEDVIYYIGFTLQQLQIAPSDLELIFNEAEGCELDLNQVKTYYTKLYEPKIEVQTVQHYLTKALELCV